METTLAVLLHFTSQETGIASLHALEPISPKSQLGHLSVLVQAPITYKKSANNFLMKTKKDQSHINTIAYSKINIPWDLKLNSGGRNRPFGKREFGSRSSSKKGCVKASNYTTQSKNHKILNT